MALRGSNGILELSREWPEPMALRPEAVNYGATVTIDLNNGHFWSGDRILFACASGIPLDLNNDGYANCPGGHGMYFGSYWDLGPAKTHVTAGSDEYYKTTGSSAFYTKPADTGLTTSFSAYIRSDQLDRVTLYSTELGAHNATTAQLLPLKRVKTSNFVITRYSSDSTYASAVATSAAAIRNQDLPEVSQPLQKVTTIPAGYSAIADSPEQRGWQFQTNLTGWALDIEASNLDMSAIGETFGENIKAMVRGAGTLDFLYDMHTSESGQDPMALLRLVLLTQEYCRANAKFYLMQNRSDNCGQLGGSAYYQCDLLLSNSRIDMRPDQIVSGSTDFVVTGSISIRVTE